MFLPHQQHSLDPSIDGVQLDLTTGTNQELRGIAVLLPLGVGICFEGFESSHGDEFITLQIINGQPEISVSANSLQDSPTHIINLLPSKHGVLPESIPTGSKNSFQLYDTKHVSMECKILSQDGTVFFFLYNPSKQEVFEASFYIHRTTLHLMTQKSDGEENHQKIDLSAAAVQQFKKT